MGDNHMQQQLLPERPPSYAQSHDPQTLNLPSVPKTDLTPSRHDRTLPPISSLLSELPSRVVVDEQESHWPSSNPYSTYYNPTHTSPRARSSLGMDSPSAMDIDVATPDSRRAGSVLSMDDPDVRLAAEALGDLRAADFHSPPAQYSSLPPGQLAQPEPLLSLLTTSHPIIGSAIGGSLSAYSASKNYSPRFKSSAEYIERRVNPVVTTVGSVGRLTGVEGGVRWFLGGRRPSHHQASDIETGSNKRRRFNDEMDIDRSAPTDPYPVHRSDQPLRHRERRPSQISQVESLPAYDDHRSPSYEFNDQALATRDSPHSPGTTWQSRLMLSTSGLSVAMSEESLRSLKYCLGWLRWANEHIGKVIDALKSVLDQYDAQSRNRITNGETGEGQMVLRDQSQSNFAKRIMELKSDVLKTLKDVVDVVSKYAGGALPENARELVRRHLTSLPQRFRLANLSTSSASSGGSKGGEGEAKESGQRILVLAREGLDMMAQVSGVLDGTILSAEDWCERLGRRKRGEAEELAMQMPPPAAVHVPGEDVKMG